MMLRMDIREITSFKGWIALKLKKKKKPIKSSYSSYVSNLIIFSSALQYSVYEMNLKVLNFIEIKKKEWLASSIT